MKNPRNDLGLTLTWWSFLTCDDHKSVKFTEFSDGGWSQFDIGFAPGNIPTGAATSHWVRGESERERCVLPLIVISSVTYSLSDCQDAVPRVSVSPPAGPGLPQPLDEVSKVGEVGGKLEPGLEDERGLREEQSDHLQVRDHDQSGDIRQEKTGCIRMSVWKVSVSCQSITANLITRLIKSL